jgi:hypothetical protein
LRLSKKGVFLGRIFGIQIPSLGQSGEHWLIKNLFFLQSS